MKIFSRTERSAAVPTGRSRLVVVLRVALPLTALAMLSTVFLVASPVDPNRALESAEIDVAERARDPRLSGASFSGVTADGSALRVSAATARTDPEAMLRFQAADLDLSVEGSAGEALHARADTGTIDRGSGEFAMIGGVELTASPGYVLTASRLSGLLDATRMLALGPVLGVAPIGEIAASRMQLSRDTDSGHHILVFSGNVRVLYQPLAEGSIE